MPRSISWRSRVLLAAALAAVFPGVLHADAPATQPAASDPLPPPSATPTHWSLDPVVVTAQKRPENAQDVSASLTAISAQTIQDANIQNILDAAAYAPDVNMSHFTNRRLVFPFIRGIGSGRNSPAVTTYIDGVPQLSYATANQEFLDVHGVEFVRGPQGTLYGRNALGGVINVNSNTPTNKLTLESTSTAGNYHFLDERATVNVPVIKDVLSVRVSGGASGRNGYATNLVTGNDVDRKEAEFGSLAVWFAPSADWDFTLRIHAERDRDGDYALSDLSSIRATPWRVSHGFEGDSLRDIAGTSLTANYFTQYATFTSVTGFQDWRSQDLTSLDYTPGDLIRRQNRERQNDFTQELRAASPTDHPLVLCDAAKLSWVGGLFVFASDYQQHVGNTYRPAAVPALGLPFAFTQYNDAALRDLGLGVFGQATITIFDKLDLTAGIRFDAERDTAGLAGYTDSPYLPTSSAHPASSFDNVSTRWGAAWHWTPDLMTYADASQGYKAGGFNATAPVDKTAFNPEHAWNYEVGTKSSWFDKRLTANVDYFYIDWRHMQLDVPTGTPDTYFIDNVGQAHSQGAEFELTGRPQKNLEIFGGVSYMQSQFDSYTQPSGISAHGNDLPFAPDVTWNVGAEYSHKLCDQATAFIRAEEVGTSRYFYDASNAASQGAYAMTNFRLGIRGHHWALEGYVENAFEAHTVPMAFPFQLAPSGYVGENGIPRLYGVSLRLDF